MMRSIIATLMATIILFNINGFTKTANAGRDKAVSADTISTVIYENNYLGTEETGFYVNDGSLD